MLKKKDSCFSNLAGFLIKLDFTRIYTEGPRRRFRSLTKVWSSKASLSVPGPFCIYFKLHVVKNKNNSAA